MKSSGNVTLARYTRRARSFKSLLLKWEFRTPMLQQERERERKYNLVVVVLIIIIVE
jgi:hypothetical protein